MLFSERYGYKKIDEALLNKENREKEIKFIRRFLWQIEVLFLI